MAAFEYVALSANGQTRTGLTEADSERHARRQLRERGLIPLKVCNAHTATTRIRVCHTRLKTERLALLTRLLATLLRSGVPLDDALLALSRQSGERHANKLLFEVRAGILAGESLANSMARFPYAFPDAYRATIAAGEQTCHLPLVLERLADHVEISIRTQQKLKLAMIYPGVLTVTALCVVGSLLAFVVPEVIRVFDSAGRQLPAITRWLISISNAFKAYGVYVAATLISAGFVLRRLLCHRHIRAMFQRTCMRLPLIGPLMIESGAAQCARTLAVLLDSGVNLVESLTVAARTASQLPLSDVLLQCATSVREGVSLSNALARHAIVPPLLPHLVATGEGNGDLVTMLDTAAKAFEHKTANAVAVITALLEPGLVLVMGAMVLFIVLAILLPIFDMNQLV